MSETNRYPPTSAQILGDEGPTSSGPTQTRGPTPGGEVGAPPAYDDAVGPGTANRQISKPARPAPPYTPHKPNTMYTGYAPTSYPSSNTYPSNTYPSNTYPSNTSTTYPPGTTYYYDQGRSICLAPTPQPAGPSLQTHPTLVAGQCHKLEMWLASKTGMRSSLVTLIMGVLLAIVCAIVGSSFLTAIFVIAAMLALAMLLWSVTLQRQRSKMLAAEEARSQVNRVQIREMGESGATPT